MQRITQQYFLYYTSERAQNAILYLNPYTQLNALVCACVSIVPTRSALTDTISQHMILLFFVTAIDRSYPPFCHIGSIISLLILAIYIIKGAIPELLGVGSRIVEFNSGDL